MRDALELVRRELGPSAAVLHTREVNNGPISRLVFGRRYEVAASAAMNVPSRLPVGVVAGARGEERGASLQLSNSSLDASSLLEYPTPDTRNPTPDFDDYRAKYRDDFRRQVSGQL